MLRQILRNSKRSVPTATYLEVGFWMFVTVELNLFMVFGCFWCVFFIFFGFSKNRKTGSKQSCMELNM